MGKDKNLSEVFEYLSADDHIELAMLLLREAKRSCSNLVDVVEREDTERRMATLDEIHDIIQRYKQIIAR